MLYPFYFGSSILWIIPGLLLAMWAQHKVGKTFEKYSKVGTRKGYTGAEVALDMMRNAGINNVTLEMTQGRLTDHYDPRTKTLRLSQDVYSSSSVASIGVAAHEVGHILQESTGYVPLVMRSVAVPVVSVGSNLAMPLFIAGLLFSWQPLILFGIGLFSLAVVFSLITLPVEFNASKRAIAALSDGGYMDADETPNAKKVLDAAALTYVASAIMAILQLVRLLALAGIGRRRD